MVHPDDLDVHARAWGVPAQGTTLPVQHVTALHQHNVVGAQIVQGLGTRRLVVVLAEGDVADGREVDQALPPEPGQLHEKADRLGRADCSPARGLCSALHVSGEQPAACTWPACGCCTAPGGPGSACRAGSCAPSQGPSPGCACACTPDAAARGCARELSLSATLAAGCSGGEACATLTCGAAWLGFWTWQPCSLPVTPAGECGPWRQAGPPAPVVCVGPARAPAPAGAPGAPPHRSQQI